MAMKQGIYGVHGLTPTELAQMEQLTQLCNSHDGLDLKVNWSTLRSRPLHETNDFLYYEQDNIVGFLNLYTFNLQEGEISGMVHPAYRRKTIFTQLYRAALEEAQRRNIPRLLLIAEYASASGQAFVKTLDISYDHSEYKMVLEEARIPSQFDAHLQFREAREEDIPAMGHITALAFEMPEEDVQWYSKNLLADMAHRYYVAIKGNICIAKLDVSLTDRQVFIYGFGVLPEYRRQGYGRQLLAYTIQTLMKMGRTEVALEVATNNKNALSLYQSCGFKETGSYDYYALDVSKSYI